MLALALDHSVQFTHLLNELVKLVHCWCKLLWLLIYLLSTIDHFLVKNLIAICVVKHLSTESWAVGCHLNLSLAFEGDEVFNVLWGLSLLSFFLWFLKDLDVFNVEEIMKELTSFHLLAPWYCLKESLIVLLSFFDLLRNLLWSFMRQRRHDNMWELFLKYLLQE